VPAACGMWQQPRCVCAEPATAPLGTSLLQPSNNCLQPPNNNCPAVVSLAAPGSYILSTFPTNVYSILE
jgi:hypothetical protein